MPTVLHTITVAFEVTTDKLTTLDNVCTAMQEAAQSAIMRKAYNINKLGYSKIEVIK